MRVRTRREGVHGSFAVTAPFSDITSAVVMPQEGPCTNPATTFPSASMQYNTRIRSRTAVLFQRIATSRHCTLPSNLKTNGSTTTATTGSVGDHRDNDSNAASSLLPPVDVEVWDALMNAADEVDRFDTFIHLSCTLGELFCWRGALVSSCSNSGNVRNTDSLSWSLLTPQEARELPARWVMQSLNDTTEVQTHRNAVTLLDCGAFVRLRHDDAVLYRVIDMVEKVGDQHWVDIETALATPAHRTRVDREELLLDPLHLVHFDPLIPADEINSPRGTSTCLFLAATLAVRQPCLQEMDAAVMQSLPKTIAVRIAQCATEARGNLQMRCFSRRAPQGALHASAMPVATEMIVEMIDDCVRLHYAGKTVEVLQRAMERLSMLWDMRVRRDGGAKGREAHELWRREVAMQAAAAEGQRTFITGEAFFIRAFTMLLRYRALLGDMGYNQGPHAAVPPVVLKQLHDAFEVQCEAFASPLNAQLPLFGSIFPDTDYYFGSIGSFFDLLPIAGHYEVNPPFVTAILRRLQTFLLDETLARHDGEDSPSLLFVVVLPSHDLDESERELGSSLGGWQCSKNSSEADNNNNDNRRRWVAKKRNRPENDGDIGNRNKSCNTTTTTATANNNNRKRGSLSADRALRESAFCLAHTLCPTAESAYVDGHQHLLRAPLFCIGTPTRLIVLGNRAARRRYGDDAALRLSGVRETWRRYTAESRTSAVDGSSIAKSSS